MRLPNRLRKVPWRTNIAAAGGLIGGLVAGVAHTRRAVGAVDRRDGEHLRLLATASDVVFRYLPAPANRFDYVSPSVEKVSGYAVEEHYADPGLIRRLVHPDDWGILLEAMRSEGPNASFELRWVRKTGEVLWVEQRVALVRNDAGKVVAVEGIARDVTARKEAEDALRCSEERHRALFETIAQGVIYYDGEGSITAANPAATRILGLTLDELRALSPLSRSWRAIREDGSDLPNEERPVEVALKTGREVKGLILGFRPSPGEMRWIRWNAAPQFRPGEDRPYGVHATLEDVTESRRAEQELRAAEERFRVAFYNAPIGIALVDLDGRYRQVNPAICEILGYGEQELLGKTFKEITHPDDLDTSLEFERRLLMGEFETYHLEKRYVCANNDPVWASLNVSLVRDARGEPLYYVAKVQDISERKEWEAALARSEERFRLVARATSEGIMDTDLRNNTLEWGGAAESLFGYGPNEPRSMEWWKDLIHPDDRDRVMASIDSVLRDGDAWSDEYRFRRADGSYAVVSNRSCVVRDEAGEPVRMIGSMLDVTERRRAEKALKESEERFRSLIQNSSDIITIVSEKGEILYQSPSMLRVLGHELRDRIGKNVFESALVHPEDLPHQAEAIRKTLGVPGALESFELRMRHRDGSWRYIEAMAQNLLEEPSVGGIVLNARDITGRRQAEEALRASEERFKSLIQNSSDMITVVGANGEIMYHSPSIERVLGHEPGSRIGKNVFESALIHPDDIALHSEAIRKTLSEPGNSRTVEMRMRHRDGSWRYIEATMRNPVAESGLHGVVANSRDITERKRTEEALRESEERFRLLAETTNDLVCLHDLDGRYLYVSPSSERLLGFAPDELVGTNPYDLMHPEDVSRINSGPRQELMRGEPQVTTTVRYRKKSGDYAWFETVTGLVRDEQGRVFRLQTSSRDVSERKAAEEALEKAARARTEFLADVSHELRTPLTVIRGNAEVGLQLRRDCVHKEGLEEIVHESGRVSRMVEDLLFLARSDASNLPPATPFVQESVSVRPFLYGLAHRAELLAREYGATLEATHGERTEGTLRVDHMRIEQAVLALVDNAAKYGPEGGTISLESGLVPGDAMLKIEVSDRGPGIPEDELPRVFERFYRASKPRNLGASDGGGTGLGLSIAKTIVESQGGRIEAQSRPGEGTSIKIYLPLIAGGNDHEKIF
ncbi:MAG: diguanylate cyclase/phosphodiesterase (GGDEF & EAL domains) with PAS/PAC sensor(s) [uncultured Rubrobacteraceae bacterium]|uniref:histidine kinase n=1 Tax=uncultured Rubrobacteraceae bacterium TaxID=349277 RepID=A0A6J4QYW6_9ACTN|nr:MAG: diguanylate cyclase/phosphodiesterase (GGDEF & EAL domains) with PAS/PAC sensor(s) [uncultured Rubrobacteraceae bacterium]